MSENAKRLSKSSPYESLFGVHERGRGRPTGSEEIFIDEGASLAMVKVARTRAYAVLHEEGKDRLTELFKAEMKVLKRREKTAGASRR